LAKPYCTPITEIPLNYYEFLTIWKPLILGTFIGGIGLRLIGYLTVWAIYWLSPWHRRVEQALKLKEGKFK
jgi:uncharacterized protein (DUF2062 family)